ncbi:hypothetical protein NR402_10825, partial [Acidithiobacillus ferrooxidans]|uniref:hypothetical protein n=1 Tax=Acidithiobacillus ferrooxidans TaxID=920 RepID=UPI00214BBCF1
SRSPPDTYIPQPRLSNIEAGLFFGANLNALPVLPIHPAHFLDNTNRSVLDWDHTENIRGPVWKWLLP